MKNLRIVFMGTPEFAVGILDTIIKNGYEVVGVVTAADKPAGRGQKLKFSAVKEYATANNLRLLQPVNLKDEEFLSELKSLKANVQVVVAFRMLPEAVWKMPQFGTFNLHASLLPDYRGAAPINWAIINGETKTGVTTFFIDDKIDTGAIILQDTTEIHPGENAGRLHDRLMSIGSKTVVATLARIESGTAVATIQKEPTELKTANKLNKENTRINWQLTGNEIYNLVRGLSPFPAAWCHFVINGEEFQVKIYDAKLLESLHNEEIGNITATKKEMRIAVSGGYLEILSLQFPGKKRLLVQEFLNGMQLPTDAKAR